MPKCDIIMEQPTSLSEASKKHHPNRACLLDGLHQTHEQKQTDQNSLVTPF
jgi:hypothetical protein